MFLIPKDLQLHKTLDQKNPTKAIAAMQGVILLPRLKRTPDQQRTQLH